MSILFITSIFLSVPLHADSLVLQALFNNKAMVKIDGRSVMLKKGKQISGYKLISADSYEAVIEYKGQRRRHVITGQPVQSKYPETAKLASVTILPDKRGMYVTTGSINGVGAEFLVDTGASVVAMNATHARTFHLSMSGAMDVPVETASGKVTGKYVKLKSVQVGGIIVRDVGAVIIPGEFPKKILLGMTFLKNINMQRKDSVIMLQARPY